MKLTMTFYEFMVCCTMLMILVGMNKPVWAGFYEMQISKMYFEGNILIEANYEKANEWYQKSIEAQEEATLKR